MNPNRWVGCAALALALVIVPAWNSTARATFNLTLQQGASTVSIDDNQPGDGNSSLGTISWSGTIGAYQTNLTIGTSNSPGSSGQGILQITSLTANNTSGSQATLTIALADTDFTQPSSPSLQLASAIGVTDLNSLANDSFTFQSYADPNNVQGGTAETTGPQSFTFPFTTTPLSYNDTATPVNFPSSGGAYSMMNVSTITLSSGGNVAINQSGTTTVQTSPGIPEPASLGILAAAGAGLTLLRRRRSA